MPKLPHTQYRGSQELKALKLDVSTPSDEACKMYDATVSQFASAYEDPTIGGLGGSLEKMTNADPNFVAGLALKLGMAAQFHGKSSKNDPGIAAEAKRMMDLCDQPSVTKWEKMHAKAINLYLDGKREMAANVYEDLLIDHPLDMAALRLVAYMYGENGSFPQLRDCFGRVLPLWKETTPFYSDALAWYGFGLEETNLTSEAIQVASKALEINPNDAWAAHCIAHVHELKGEFTTGLKWMETTEKDWSESLFNCHNYWHWALFQYEAGNFEDARGILDQQCLPMMKKNKSPFSMTDVSSLMFRLESQGVPVVGWEDCFEIAREHLDDLTYSFNDVHFMVACTGAKRKEEADKFINDVKNVIETRQEDDLSRVYKQSALPLFEAIQAYGNEEYDKAVELLKPVRYTFIQIGGSNAQRDLFTLILIQSALRSKNYQEYARRLIAERQQLKKDTPLMEKMLQKLIIEH